MDTQFKNEHNITKRIQKMRELKSKGYISDYLVKLKDLDKKIELCS
jgi:hypothetical protein